MSKKATKNAPEANDSHTNKLRKGRKGQQSGSKAAKPQDASQTAVSLDNCYRQGSAYWASVRALKALGVGKMHAFDKIVPAVKRAMGSGWGEFAKRKGKMTAEERVLCN